MQVQNPTYFFSVNKQTDKYFQVEERGTVWENGRGDQEPVIGSNERIMIIAL